MLSPHTEIIDEIHYARDSEELLEVVQKVCQRCLNSSFFNIFFIDEETNQLILHDSNTFENYHEDQQALTSKIQSELITKIQNNYLILNSDEVQEYKLSAIYQLNFQGIIYGYFTLFQKDCLLLENEWIEDFINIAKAICPEIIKMQMLEASDTEVLMTNSKLHGMYNSLELVKNSDLDTVLTKLMNLALQTVDGQVGSIMIFENNNLITKTDLGFQDEIAQIIFNDDNEKFIDYAVAQDTPTHIPNTKDSNLINVSNLPVNINSIISIPLKTQNRTLGLLNIINNEENHDDINYESLISFCNLSSYALENSLMYQKDMEYAKLKESIDIAQNIHTSLLPRPSIQIKNLEIFGWSQTCDETGGDYYDILTFDEDRIDIIVGDATGHGIGAALTMLITRSSLRTLYQQNLPLDKIYELLNNRLSEDTNDEKFMTLFSGTFNLVKNTLSYCSAGHDAPFLIRNNENIQELEATGIPLGMMENMEFELIKDIPLQPGDLIITGSDGTWEAMNPINQEFGKQRIIDIAKEFKNESAKDINLKIQQAIKEFIADQKIRDDMTLIIIKVK